MAAPPRAWRRSGACSSSSTGPGPTGGSWAASPTSTSRQLGGRASSRACIRGRSTIDTSSTTSRSRARGCWRLRPKRSPRLSSSRCRVLQGSCRLLLARAARSRLAALPVGAASWMRLPGCWASTAANMRATVLVLPVPGPPSSSTRPYCSTAVTARCWSGSRPSLQLAPGLASGS